MPSSHFATIKAFTSLTSFLQPLAATFWGNFRRLREQIGIVGNFHGGNDVAWVAWGEQWRELRELLESLEIAEAVAEAVRNKLDELAKDDLHEDGIHFRQVQATRGHDDALRLALSFINGKASPLLEDFKAYPECLDCVRRCVNETVMESALGAYQAGHLEQSSPVIQDALREIDITINQVTDLAQTADPERLFWIDRDSMGLLQRCFPPTATFVVSDLPIVTGADESEAENWHGSENTTISQQKLRPLTNEEFSVLEVLAKNPSIALVQVDISEKSRVSRRSVAKILPILEQDGLAERKNGPRKGYSITPLGKKMHANCTMFAP